ncbi:sodium/potassium/calcium exchanger 5-like isoform X2 [Aphis gossypii]|uniref:sodium/potassium/calcium exchanger 5-like isoform X2 n=1 Tax=Aphis gossypii TaxID=80765 RepID=UPI0021598450|nr:sodium/potassium/calcium exchanger 5-like isoform X2 [Aphis gossypii]
MIRFDRSRAHILPPSDHGRPYPGEGGGGGAGHTLRQTDGLLQWRFGARDPTRRRWKASLLMTGRNNNNVTTITGTRYYCAATIARGSLCQRAIMYKPVLGIVFVLVAFSAHPARSSSDNATAATTAVASPADDSTTNDAVRGNDTSGSYEFNNSSTITCENVSRSIDDFPPDFFTDDQRRHGAVVFHFLVAFYGFVFIAFVCNDYFLPSVFCICLDLGISPDVAGATFMATATCAPELFVSVIGTFLTESDLGVGTVVGSAIYNTLGVSACAGLAARKAINLEKWPLLRDSGVYLVSIIALAIIVVDDVVMWYEALFLLFMYFGYFLLMFTQGKLRTAAKKLKNKNSFRSSSNSMKPPAFDIGYGVYRSFYFTEYVPPPPVKKSQTSKDPNEIDIEEPISPIWKVPTGVLPIMWWVFSLPVAFMLSVTVPDCRTRRKVYPFTFIMCIIWIGISSYIVSWMLSICGDTFHISDIVMGIGVLAAGGSIPEATSGIINARNGEGSMSISNALGANTLDILLCLGLPWFIKSLMPLSMNGGPILMETNDLFFNCICLIISVIVLNIAAAANGFKMYKTFGIICLVGHICIITIFIISGLNVKKAEIRQC